MPALVPDPQKYNLSSADRLSPHPHLQSAHNMRFINRYMNMNNTIQAHYDKVLINYSIEYLPTTYSYTYTIPLILKYSNTPLLRNAPWVQAINAP